MIAMHMSQQNGMYPPPVKPERGHFVLDLARFPVKARVDQDQSLTRFNDIDCRGGKAAKEMEARYERDRVGPQDRDAGQGVRDRFAILVGVIGNGHCEGHHQEAEAHGEQAP
jgi:hypothetical protein